MAEINQLTLGNDTYDLRDASAVHTVDSAMSSSSTNPVQNKVVKEYVDGAIKNGPYIRVVIGFGVMVLFENFTTSPTTYSGLIADADFKMALARPVVVDYGSIGTTIIQGLILNMDSIPASNHWQFRFPDAVVFNGTLTNGLEGDLTYDEGDGWYLDNLEVCTPEFKNYTDDAISNLSLVSTQVEANATEAATPASGDGLIFADSDDSNKLKRMTSGFDTTNTTSFLRQDGTWATPPSGEAPVARIFHGTCSTAAGTVAKVVTCPEFTSNDFVAGAIVFVTFTKTNSGTAANVTLNVNSTGAKGVRYMRNAAESNLPGNGYLRANMTYRFVYTGTYWVCDTDYDSDRFLVYRSFRVASGAGSLYSYKLVAIDNNGDIIPFNNVTTDATTTYTKAMNTKPFNPFRGFLYYMGTTTTSAGSVRDANEFAASYTFDCRYSFNINSSGTAGSTALTAYDPVYVRALYDTSTRLATFSADSSSASYLERSSIVQALPSSDPNTGLATGTFYIYILVGQAYTKYNIALFDNNTVYYWNTKAGMTTEFTGIIEANLEYTSNKVTTISELSTNTEYPSAKAAYDALPAWKILTSDSYYGFTAGTPTGTSRAAGVVAQDVYNDLVDYVSTGEKSIVIIDDAKVFDYDDDDIVRVFELAEVNNTEGEIVFYCGGDTYNYVPENLRIDSNDTYRIFYATPAPHSHGHINDSGQMTDTAASVASGDKLLIASSGSGNAIKTADIAFDTTNTTDYLRKDGTWATPSGGGGGGSTDEVPFVTCTSSITAANKTVDLSGFTLSAGKRLYVQFTKGNTATQPTLNVNSTGAKYLRYNNTNLASTTSGVYRSYIEANRVLEVVYDGSAWAIINGLENALLTTNGSSSRATNMDRSVGRGCLEYLLSYANTPTGHPRDTAKILHCNWDSNTTWASQLAIGTVSQSWPEGWIQYRGQNGNSSGAWTQWYDVAIERDGTCTLTDGDSFSFTANYHKIGKQVTVYGTIPTGGSANSLSGLPYAASAEFSSQVMFQSAMLTSMILGKLSVASAGTSISFAGFCSIGSMNTMSAGTWLGQVPSAGVPFNFTYFTATP